MSTFPEPDYGRQTAWQKDKLGYMSATEHTDDEFRIRTLTGQLSDGSHEHPARSVVLFLM